MKIKKLQEITSQKGYKINDQFFVAYEGNLNFDSSNEDYKDCIEYIKNGGIVLPEFTPEEALEKTRNNKLADLNKFYNSSECWTYTLFTNNATSAVLKGIYASLTKDAYFFGRCLPAGAGNKLLITTDDNFVIEYDLTVEKAQILNFQINIKNGEEIKRKKNDLENRINLANNIDDITNIDYQKELLNAVERKINLDII